MTQQINLFNSDFLKQKKIFTSVTMARALAVLLVGVLALTWYGREHTAKLKLEADSGAARLAAKKVQQERLLKEFAPRKSDPGLPGVIATAEAEQATVRDIAAVLEGGSMGDTSGYSPYFTALARQSMTELWLTGISIEGAGTQISLRGRALEAELVPSYIARLTREAIMQGKEFGGLQITRPTAVVVAAKDGPTAVELAPYIDFNLSATGAATVPPVQKPSEAPPVELKNLQKAMAEASK